jgi:hypothetical protein
MTELIKELRIYKHTDSVYSLAVKIPSSTIFYGRETIACREAFERFLGERMWAKEFLTRFPEINLASLEVSDDISNFIKLDKSIYNVIEFGCCEVLKHAEFGSHCLAVVINIC